MQSQKYTENTIQFKLEQGLFNIYKDKIKISYSGRTDSGVNAYKQVIHFDLEDKFSEETIKNALNFQLKNEDISVNEIFKVNSDFHARLSTRQRIYCYKIINSDKYINDIFFKNTHWFVRKFIDLAILESEAKKIIGKMDFTVFRKAECQSKRTIITIDDIEIKVKKVKEFYGNFDDSLNEIFIFVKARSFLHGMVRFIVGTLIEIATKTKNIDILEIIKKQDISMRGLNAPAKGLYLYDVLY